MESPNLPTGFSASNSTPTDNQVFNPSFMSCCNESFKAKLVEKRKNFSPDALASFSDRAPDSDENEELFSEFLIDYFESVIREIFVRFQPFMFPDLPAGASAEEMKMFDLGITKRRVHCVIECTVEAISRMPGWNSDHLNRQPSNDIVTLISFFVYLLVVYPIYNFPDGPAKWYKAEASELPNNTTRRYFGFWLSYFNNMDVDFTEMALLFPLSVCEATKNIYPDNYETNLKSTEQSILSVLKKYSLSRQFPPDAINVGERWFMLSRNLPFIFDGIFHCGRESIMQVNSLMQGGSSSSSHSNMDTPSPNPSTGSSSSYG